MKKVLVIVCIGLFSVQCLSDEYSVTTKIKTLFMGPLYGSKVFIEVENRPSGNRPAGCDANSNFDFVIDLSSDYGKEYYSSALAAYASGKTVRLESYNTCNAFGSVPDLKSIWLK